MTEKLSTTFPTTSDTTDDSQIHGKKTKKNSAKSAKVDEGKLTSTRLEHLEQKVAKALEEKKKEEARLRKLANREKTILKKKERTIRDGQNILVGVVYEIESEKNAEMYDQTTRLLDKHLIREVDRKRFEERIPARHRSERAAVNKEEEPQKATA